MFQAKDIMKSDVISVLPEDTVDHAISLLVDNQVSGLPVVDADGSLVGVITEFDLLELICDCSDGKGRVADYMSSDVCSVDEETDWVAVADMLRERRMRRLPVTRNGRLVGIVARHDLIRVIQGSRKRLRGAKPGSALA